MGAVRMLAASDLRRRWRSTIAITLLVGVVGALILAAAAGARRSDTALDRFNAFSRTSDLEISIGPTPRIAQLEAFRKSPGVEAFARLHGYSLGITAYPALGIAVPIDDAMGSVVDRARVISGREPNPRAPDEVTVGEGFAANLHLRVGSTFDATSYTPQQVYDGFHGKPVFVPHGPTVRLRVVGIVRRPLDLGIRAASGGVVLLTPAFTARYGARIGLYTDVLRVEADRRRDVPEVVTAARRIWGKEPTFGVQPLGVETEGARNAIDVLTLTLWIFAAVAALAGAVAIGIVLSREITRSAVSPSTLRAIGVTRRQAVTANAARAPIVAVGGALIAVIVAVLLSPRFPMGVARRADPDVGLHADWNVLLLGMLAIGAAVVAIALVAAWRAIRTTAADHTERRRGRTSSPVELATRVGLRPAATNGLRMALEAGRGSASVPVRTAFAGAIFGVAGITAVLVFGASLAHLVDTPRLAGWTWNLRAEVPTDANPKVVCVDRDDHGLGHAPGVAAVAAVCIQNVEVDGRAVAAWGVENLRGDAAPEVVAGRVPQRPDEVALGAVTLRAVHKHLGERVTARSQGGARIYRIVGRVVLPAIAEAEPLADGALFTADGMRPILEKGDSETHFLLARYNRDANDQAIRRVMQRDRMVTNISDRPGLAPVEVERVRQINAFPAVLAGLLGALALVAVGHTLVTSVRRRRRELALFKTVGFRRRQVAASVAWQATTVGVIGLVVGIPIGLVCGRLVWRAVANSLGVAVVVQTPVGSLVAMAAAALVLVNVIAFLPGRAAARTKPAVALRAE